MTNRLLPKLLFVAVFKLPVHAEYIGRYLSEPRSFGSLVSEEKSSPVSVMGVLKTSGFACCLYRVICISMLLICEV